MNLPAKIRRVLDSVLGPHGHLDRRIRIAAADLAAAAGGGKRARADLPEALEPYVDKVARAPYKVLDRDIDALRAQGLSEDQIFDLTVATAIGAAVGRYEKTLEILGEDES